MGIFRRKRRDDTSASPDAFATGQDASPDAAEDAPTTADAPPTTPVTPDDSRPAGGPLDRSQVEDADGYVDLGALWLPAVPGLMLTMEIDESTGDVTAVRVHHGDSVLQLQAFAAPRSTGIWDEIRDELVAGIEAQGGTADVRAGSLGVEVLAGVPGRGAGQSMLFVGVDGPRWFVRGVVSGPAATDADSAAPFLDLLRACVVVRGTEPMGPRELLPLTVPTEPEESGEVSADDAPSHPGHESLDPFVRGPEITETR